MGLILRHACAGPGEFNHTFGNLAIEPVGPHSTNTQQNTRLPAGVLFETITVCFNRSTNYLETIRW